MLIGRKKQEQRTFQAITVSPPQGLKNVIYAPFPEAPERRSFSLQTCLPSYNFRHPAHQVVASRASWNLSGR